MHMVATVRETGAVYK